MPVDLYYLEISPPCRAVILTAKAVGLELNLKELDIFKGAQMKPEFLALNPQHCIPTLVDGDFVVWESRPTCSYLASKYGKDDSLYPTDPQARAKVERLNYFDMGTLFHRFGEYVDLNPEKLERLQEALGWLDGFINGHKFVAGDNITVADHTLLATVSTIKEANVDLSKHCNVLAWLDRCKAMPGYDANQRGAEGWGKFFKSRCNL
ncbi:Glutathione S-transferase 1, isoform C [Chionoecetes opilio]|uniref:Glutathione S-transferase 1, isoform C n=1 Tax=Chionoecetes opilio TaxID=41210 RepID=A0A8J5CKJ9_CHIOP|nr:Glutathione S-transferase 1, isoform C [Chionoecetes opilio]